MVYFIYGNQSPTIKSQIKKIAKTFLGEQENIDEFNFVKLDGHNVVIQEAVDEAKYVSLGYDKKVVSIENCYFLEKPKPKNKIESDQDYDVLKKYLKDESEDPDACLILSVVNASIDEKNEIVSLLKEKGKVVEISDPDEKTFLEYIRSYCKKYEIVIDGDAVIELAARTDGDVSLFKNSIEKLTLYTDHIRYEDVTKMVTRKMDDDAFLISNLLIEGKNAEAVKLYKDLKTFNIEPVTLISNLANQFRLINQVRYCLKVQRMSNDEAAKVLKIKPGRVYVLSKNIPLLSEETIFRILDDLYQLDLDIKSGQVDRHYAFEMFLLKFKRN